MIISTSLEFRVSTQHTSHLHCWEYNVELAPYLEKLTKQHLRLVAHTKHPKNTVSTSLSLHWHRCLMAGDQPQESGARTKWSDLLCVAWLHTLLGDIVYLWLARLGPAQASGSGLDSSWTHITQTSHTCCLELLATLCLEQQNLPCWSWITHKEMCNVFIFLNMI